MFYYYVMGSQINEDKLSNLKGFEPLQPVYPGGVVRHSSGNPESTGSNPSKGLTMHCMSHDILFYHICNNRALGVKW